MFLAHAPISYLTNEIIQKRKIQGLKPSQQIFVAVCSLIFGLLPDGDFLIMMMTNRPPYTHHDVFTHTPIYWLALCLVVTVIVKLVYPKLNNKTKQFLTKDVVNILLIALLLAGLSHFFADLLVGNIMLFYPFTSQPFTIFQYLFEPSYFTGYFLSVYFAIELVIVSIALRSLSKQFFKKVLWDDIVSYTLLALTSIYLLFTIFLNTQTYNKSFLEDSSKPYIDFDMDFDTLRDTEDLDADNDGIDNILGANEDAIVDSLETIIASNKATLSGEEDIWDKVLNRFGGLTSYRLVSQAYYENYSPIEPVLKDFYIKSLEQKRYSVNFDYNEVLREYLISKDLLIELNLEDNPILPSGKIFFILDKDGKVTNMGMSMRNNQVAIVLPGEQKVQFHTYEGIRIFYADTISTFQIHL